MLLLIIVVAAASCAATLRFAEAASGRALSSARVAQQYDDLRAGLLEAELLRHQISAGELAADDVSLVGAAFLSQAVAQVTYNGLGRSQGGLSGVDAVFAASVSTYQKEDGGWKAGRRTTSDQVGLHDAVAALDRSLQIERKAHQRRADADERRRTGLLTALWLGVLPALCLLLLAGAAAARAAGRRREEARVAGEVNEWNSLHDPMTGLPNRLALSNKIAAVGPEVPVALLWLDLDDFKLINDSLGHAFGDLVLMGVADRLVEVVRPDDFVARIGGDEFVVLCTGLASAPAAMHLAERLVAAMRQPLALPQGPRVVTTSVGVALASGGASSGVFAAADAAMYQAKHAGGGGAALFDERLSAEQADRLALGDDLRGAAVRGELRLHYQPVLNLRTGQVRGVEALVRWQHPDRGLLGPDAFIDIAEETGTVLELGEWVLNEACRVLAGWQKDSPSGKPLRMSVNVSAKQLTDVRLVESVMRALANTRVDAGQLTIEVTESAVMADVDAATRTLQELRAAGLHLSIDDFGTGYSSLTYLKQFPVHELKLDKTFVDGVGTNAEDSAIVAAVLGLARAVDLEVVAEGVENTRQRTVLQTLGCDYGQGYLWQRPVPQEAIETWIAAYVRTRARPRRDERHSRPAVPSISPSRRKEEWDDLAG